MKNHTMQKAAEGLLQRAGIVDTIGSIGTFRLERPSERTVDWILSDLAGDVDRGQAGRDEGPSSSGTGSPVPANEAYRPKVFVGSGDRGVYGFGAAPGERLPSSLLFVLDPATLQVKVQRGLLSTVLVLSGGGDCDVVVLRGNRLGRTRTAPAIAAILQLISATPPGEA